jgi:serine/threonine protein kinase
MRPGRKLTTWCGSPIYAAPELIMRRDYIGPKTDVWALGVILYALVTGCMPWSTDGNERITQLTEFFQGKFVFPSSCVLSTAVRDLISRMLRADPEERISIEEIKVHPWIVRGRGAIAPLA